MFNSTVLDVAAGLIFTFLTVSVTVSAIVEALASRRGWRAATLLEAVKRLLNDPEFTGLALRLYNHALINPLTPGTALRAADLKHLPSYIDSGQFADALLQVTNAASGAPPAIATAIDAIQDEQLRHFLRGVCGRTAGDAARMRAEVAAWFDNAMDRIGGVYKRHTQAWSLGIALLVAAACNIDAVAIGRALWQQPMLARTILASADPAARDGVLHLAQLQLPVGWSWERWTQLTSPAGFAMFAGWLITALATPFGAPFWFDLLQQFVRLKGSGPSPQEKRDRTAAAA